MGLHHSPFAVTDGLVLYLDAGNKKTFANSVINSTSWDLGSGSASGYGQNGNTNENERVLGTDPFGKSAIVWETRASGDGNADGGWNSDWYNIDNTKLYRFSVWVKRTSTSSGGTFYLGLYGNASGVRRTDTNAYEGNPYWECSGTSKFDKDVWYLVVGHCYPYNTSYTGQHPETGIYTVAGGATKVLSINACNIGTDVKWAGSDVTQTIHRCYHYYCGDSTTRLQLFDPRIDAIDGTEPSISALLSGFTANRLSDLVGSNNGTFKNAPTYSSANGGSIVFDGTNDWLPTSLSIGDANTSFSWGGFVKVNSSTTSNFFLFGNYTENTTTPFFAIAFNNSGDNTFIYIRDSTGGTEISSGSTNLDLNTWYYLIGVRDAGANQVKLYVNGELRDTDTFAGSHNVKSTTNNFGAVRHLTNYANCTIGTIHVYNRALSAAEISQNFQALRGRFGI